MPLWGTTSDSQLQAQSRYDATHTRSYSLKLNTKTDEDIIRWLRTKPSTQGAIKQLIWDQIKREAGQITPKWADPAGIGESVEKVRRFFHPYHCKQRRRRRTALRVIIIITTTEERVNQLWQHLGGAVIPIRFELSAFRLCRHGNVIHALRSQSSRRNH